MHFLVGTDTRIVAYVRQKAMYQTNDDVIVLLFGVGEDFDDVAVKMPLLATFDLAEYADAGQQL